MYQWTVCSDVSVSQWRIQGCEARPGNTTQGNSQRAAIQPHLPPHRKHLAVYRKCLMKECCICLDLVTDDDFSWFLRTGRHSSDKWHYRWWKRYLCISSEAHFLQSVCHILQELSTGGLSAVAKLVPWSQKRFAALFTVFTINVFPVCHPLLNKAPDFWNANEEWGCLFVLLFWWLNEQWQAARVVIVVQKWTSASASIYRASIRYSAPLLKWKTNQNSIKIRVTVNNLSEYKMSKWDQVVVAN